MERLGICEHNGQADLSRIFVPISAYNTGWKPKIPLMVPVEENDQGSEQAMEDNWDDDRPVNSAFDEAENKWPSISTQ